MRASAFLTCVMLLGAGSVARAQGLGFGAKGGMNLATLQFEEPDPAVESLPGLVAGGFVNWPITGRLALQPEGLFSRKGTSFDEEGAPVKILLDYIDIPVLARYALSRSPRRTIYVFGGPSLNFLLRAKNKADVGDASIEIDTKDEMKVYELSVVGGAEVEFGRVLLGGRYAWGITDIDKVSDDATVRTRVISVMAGFRF
jgi:hypothetical protein